MNPAPPPGRAASPADRRRQARTIAALAGVLIVGGLALVFLVDRLPLPFRLFLGLGDVIAGCVLLVVLRQKFR
jgi:hypothetical protein